PPNATPADWSLRNDRPDPPPPAHRGRRLLGGERPIPGPVRPAERDGAGPRGRPHHGSAEPGPESAAGPDRGGVRDRPLGIRALLERLGRVQRSLDGVPDGTGLRGPPGVRPEGAHHRPYRPSAAGAPAGVARPGA